MFIAARIVAGGFSGVSSDWRCAFGIRGEYIIRWRRVLSFMRDRLLDSGEGYSLVSISNRCLFTWFGEIWWHATSDTHLRSNTTPTCFQYTSQAQVLARKTKSVNRYQSTRYQTFGEVETHRKIQSRQCE